MLCTDCNHKDICKHQDEYNKLLNEINVNVSEPFTLRLGCKHYYSTTTYLGSIGYYDEYSNSSSSTVANLDKFLYKPHPGQP